ncbi:MAG TPA: TetR family transcriptional regulator [Chitinophagaceae bacterium]|nr:TetR family transcriptional regulator [Chitinophagaceae bacterium]
MDKKEQIINAAIELFAQKGFEGTSIRDLASKADVNVAMINYYFGSKEKLFEALVEMKAATTRGTLESFMNDKNLSSIQKIDRIIDSYIERLFSNRMFHRVIHQELMLNQREALQHIITNMLYPNTLIIKSIIEDGVKKKEFRKVDAELTISTLVGTINQVLLSKKYCLKLLDKEPGYVPYEDPVFIKRMSTHLKQLMHAHLTL